ncbi:hypothetical protein T08_12741 [Trichinella sp. T8]|nr:hypothetical protein T08_12741 [Trichinella sp. T8]
MDCNVNAIQQDANKMGLRTGLPVPHVLVLKHFTSVFVAFRFFPAITCDFKSTVPMMTSDFENK